SLGFKIKDKTWPNTLKMTLPGRLKLQKFLYQAKKAGCRYVVLEATSEGIVQHRLAGIKIDCAVYTNLHREHLESHGSFDNYMIAKQKLFLKTRGIHVLNIDDPYFEKFANFPAKQKITYGWNWGMITPLKESVSNLNLQIIGDFNSHNALAALSVANVYNLDLGKAVDSLNAIELIPGRMEVIDSAQGFKVVIDYAHTPDSLELVYKTLKPHAQKLICVLGAAGGGRDKWKRPEFGKIAAKYCDEVILTNEDPYDENPDEILEQIALGFSLLATSNQQSATSPRKILDRKEAIRAALTSALAGDIVVITGKGSEISMAIAGGRKIPWSDKDIVKELLK
ncbi:MAG: Mur ligase family protein, partial [Candidatus Azambacteria bacterium]|nr:Mur ligase family protein [Candidatus Azambacteria bacterium]